MSKPIHLLMRAKRRVVDSLLPLGTPQRRAVGRLLHWLKGHPVPHSGMTYETWMRTIEPKTFLPPKSYAYEPLISIVVPAFNTPDKYLGPMLDSVVAQTYRRWELVLVQGSTKPERAEAIRAAAKRDPRIKLVEAVGNKLIVANTNEGIAAATGEYIAFMDHDDTLAAAALNEIVAVLQARPQVDVFYTDEDKLSDDGRYRTLPLFKPDWSPILLTTVNYVSHLNVVRRSLVSKVGGLRQGFDGAQDYDFILRLLQRQPVIHHIPKVLYHWRQAAGSTAIHPDRKDYVATPAVSALKEYATRSGFAAEVLPVENMPTTYRYKYALPSPPPVVVCLAAASQVAQFEQNVHPRTSYANYRLESGPVDLASLEAGTLLLFLDPQLRPEHDDWLTELVSVAVQPGQGLVGGWIRTADGRTAETGYVVEGETIKPLFKNALPSTWYHNGHALWPRNLLMVSPHCATVAVEALHGLAVSSEAVRSDLLRMGRELHQAGRLNTFWPYAKLLRPEPTSAPGVATSPVKPAMSDPFFNANLTIVGDELELNPRPPRS